MSWRFLVSPAFIMHMLVLLKWYIRTEILASHRALRIDEIEEINPLVDPDIV